MNTQKLSKLKNRYLKLYPDDTGVKNEELEKIQKTLNINLPEDFKLITSFYSGGFLGDFSIFTISSDDSDDFGIINRALVFRDIIKLPEKYLPLYSEYGFVYVDLDSTSKNFKKVIYCSPEEAQLLSDRSFPKEPYWAFPSFTDFFEYLITEEENERASSHSE